VKAPRQQFKEEYSFLTQFIRREENLKRPCRKLIDLLYDLRFAVAVELRKWSKR
jgi:hypothetical protein